MTFQEIRIIATGPCIANQLQDVNTICMRSWYIAAHIWKMFLIDNICVSFGGTLFQQVVGIPMGTNCAPLLADLFLYSYESEFLQKLLKDKKIHEARAFNFTYRYIDDVLYINNSRFAEFLPLIYPPELEVKETTDTASSASFLDLYLEFDDNDVIYATTRVNSSTIFLLSLFYCRQHLCQVNRQFFRRTS
jgi:hypothetical protein